MKKAFLPIANANSHTLILGTMPGEKSLELQQYYGNRANQFWRLVYAVFNEPMPETYEEKIAFLKQKGIALWDVLSHCERVGSLDSNIKNEVPNDFETFFKTHPNIKRVFFSSKNAEKYYSRYAKKLDGVVYSALPSPSGAHATMRFEEKLAIWKNILNE